MPLVSSLEKGNTPLYLSPHSERRTAVHIGRRGVPDTRNHGEIVNDTLESANSLRTLSFGLQRP